MNAAKIIQEANMELDTGRITLGEYRKRIEPFKDVESVVRCKDCKWYKEGYDIDGKWFSRCNGSVRTYGHTKPDWFCADAERR